MNFVALRMLMGERAKYLGLIFAIAFSMFLLENQTSIFAGILKCTASQVLDVTDADVWVMDPRTQYFEQTRALKVTDRSSTQALFFLQAGSCVTSSPSHGGGTKLRQCSKGFGALVMRRFTVTEPFCLLDLRVAICDKSARTNPTG